MLANGDSPSRSNIKALWQAIAKETRQSGQWHQVSTEVILGEGQKISTKVNQLSAFALFNNDVYLNNQQGELVALNSKHLPSPKSRLLFDPKQGELLKLEQEKTSLISRIISSGLIAYLIIVLFAIGLVLSIERYWQLLTTERRIKIQSRQAKPLDNNPLGRIMLSVENRLSHQAPLDSIGETEAQTFEHILDDAIVKELPALEKRVGIIKLLATMAPMLGLLGTVVGMIISFQAMAIHGSTDIKLLAGGISTALTTTVLGLCAAMPLLLLYTLLQSKSQALIQILEQQTAGILVLKLLNNKND